MTNNYEYDSYLRRENLELKADVKELQAYKTHMEEAYASLQAERDALAEENQKLVFKILKLQGN